MKLLIVSVRDSAADLFGRPYFVGTQGIALRSFTDEVNRESEDNQLNRHAKDFALYELGEYDDNTGQITTHDQPKLLINADQCLLK